MVSSDPVAWEQRWHPLREEWVIVAAHRQDRPWQGERRPRLADTAAQHTSRTAISARATRA